MVDNVENVGKKKLRVLQIIGSPAMGGIENQLLFFLQRYDRSRFVVDVACDKSTEGLLRDKYLATNTRLMLCRWTRYVFPFVWRLYWLLRRGQYDVVHARMSEISGAAMLAARLVGVPVRVASYHNTDTQWRRQDPVNRFMTRAVVCVLQWMTRRWATKILSVSCANLDKYFPDWRQYPEKIQPCHNGIDIERFTQSVDRNAVRSELGLPNDCFVVGHVGSFRKQKNHQTIVDIAEQISRQLGEVYFLLVGDGDLRERIEQEVANRALASRFVFAGNRSDVPRMLATMDIFLMPSLYEGLPSVVLEAQLRELVVVGSDLACIREAMCPAMHKFCCNCYDAEGMAQQVIMLLQDQQLRHSLGREGCEFVKKAFSIERTVKQLESVYDSKIV